MQKRARPEAPVSLASGLPASPKQETEKTPVSHGESSPVGSSSVLYKSCHKTKVCKFYSQGNCNRGARCTFAHGCDNLQPLPDLSYTKLCPQMEGCSDPACRFAHCVRELRRIVSHAIDTPDAGGDRRQPLTLSLRRPCADSSPTPSAATTAGGCSGGRDDDSDIDAMTEASRSMCETTADDVTANIRCSLPQVEVLCRVRNTFFEFGPSCSSASLRRSRSAH